MRLNAKQASYLQAMGIDVWCSREQLASQKKYQWVVSSEHSKTAATWLWLLEGDEMTAMEQALLQKICLALDLKLGCSELQDVEVLSQQPVAAVVCLGVSAASGLSQFSAKEVTVGSQGPWGATHLLVTFSLQDMINNTSCKRDVWQQLQALQSKVGSKANGVRGE